MIDGGGVCALAAVQISNSPKQHSVRERPDKETRDDAACEDRDMRAPDTEEAPIVIRAYCTRQALASRSVVIVSR
ncbi:hypothetical protein XvhCFBP2543_01955 [Xanthomonas vasicola]|uniref:Uncharacterized protein n=1 Tax=Xanthomonas vasicola TaxID=56459 RepID=A0ABD7SF56_XANVA|nr:hypothetical protein [Xanthomonas vasicola]AZR23420.1 hypothetical protein NX81_015240 [Xanthomonas vasicola]KGR39598.1 hypothetical protein NX04_18115 [Xanthomonas vasicola]KGR58752.1 hypothetical protein NX79_17830 [Xanthomonas vasicola]KNX94003.1 hypothetical protein NX05_22355 [Xanthomonas vasicola]PPV04299.1 hypothetical protein XvhCFBP2543_01955 [Xanthomonas vasicola]